MNRFSLPRVLALVLLCLAPVLPGLAPFVPATAVYAQTNLTFNPTPPPTPAPTLNFTPNQAANLNAQLAAAQAQLTLSQTQLSQSQAQYTAEQAQYTQTQSQLTSTQTQLASTLALLSASQPQIAAVQAQLNAAQSALTTAQAATATATTAQQAAQAQVTTLTAQVASLTAAAQAQAAQVTTLQAQIATQSGQITTYQSQIASQTSQITTLNAQVSSLTAQVTSLTAQVAAGTGTPAAVRTVVGLDQPPSSPAYISPGYYGSNQPLLIAQNPIDLVTYYTQAVAAGIDVLAVDTFLDPTGTLSRLPTGDSIGLKFMPCLDTSFEGGKSESQVIADVVQYCTQYVAGAAGHTSAAMVGTKYEICTYNDSAHMSGNDWSTVRQTLATNNIPVSFFGDVGGQYLTQGADSTRQSTFAGFASPFDQLYCFGPATTTDGLDSLLEGFVGSGKPFASTIRPAYLKVVGDAASGNAISYEDAQGTQTLQQRWQAADALAFVSYPAFDRTLFLSTWSDFSEASGIMPSTDMGTTLSDVNAWYAAQYKGQALPWSSVRLYLTVQQSAYLNGSARIEALVLNGSASRVYVKSVIQNLNAQNLTGQFGGPVAPYSAQTFTYTFPDNSATLAQAAINGVHAIKEYCTVANDVTGQQILGMGSAWALLYPTAAPSGGGQALYYSVASDHTTGYTPSGTLNISPSGVKTLSVTPAGNGYVPRSLELLHDTRRAYISYGTGAVTNVVFTDANGGADNRNDGTDHGCYVIREVTTGNQETYSDPINVTHH